MARHAPHTAVAQVEGQPRPKRPDTGSSPASGARYRDRLAVGREPLELTTQVRPLLPVPLYRRSVIGSAVAFSATGCLFEPGRRCQLHHADPAAASDQVRRRSVSGASSIA